MAKKKESLSFEERLEQALVADWEQPYKVPSNWVWTRLGNTISLHRGVSYKKTDVHSEKLDNDCLILRGGNIEEGQINLFCSDNVYVNMSLLNSNQLIQKHDVIIVSSTGSVKVIGRAGISMETYLDVGFGAFLTLARPYDNLYKLYISYFFQSDLYRQRIQSLATGVNINNIRNDYINETCIPLPPLAEQQRIVDRIESLFSKLDEAKEKAQTALDSFENRKAAILHKAFTGELTAKWREENGVELDSWSDNTLGEFANTKYGYTESANSEMIGPKFLRITDIQDGFVDWVSVPYCPISDDDYIKYKLNQGDIVVARTGATTGKSYMIIDDVVAVFASYLIRINTEKPQKLSPEYLYKFLQSQLYWNQITELSSGIAQPGVNANKLKTIRMAIPSLPEQTEIVRILDGIFEKEKQAKELASVIEKIDLMKKAILARAFRGELGTNDPQEESALELLKEILEESKL